MHHSFPLAVFSAAENAFDSLWQVGGSQRARLLPSLNVQTVWDIYNKHMEEFRRTARANPYR